MTSQNYIIDSIEMLDRLFAYSNKIHKEYIVIDVETDSLVMQRVRLFGIGICFNTSKSFYIVWRDKAGNEIWNAEQQQIIKDWLFDVASKSKVICHNASYDILVLENTLQLYLADRVYCDTQLLKHTLDEERPFGLKDVSFNLFGPDSVKAQGALKQSVLDNGGRWSAEEKDMYKAETAILGEYCCWDVNLTMRLFEYYFPKLKEQNLEELFFTEVMPLSVEVVFDMKRKGFPIDVSHFERLKSEISVEIIRLEEEIQQEIQYDVEDYVGQILEKEFPPLQGGNFPKAVATYLNIPLPVDKKTGKTTLAAKALAAQAKSCPEFNEYYDWLMQKEYKEESVEAELINEETGLLEKVMQLKQIKQVPKLPNLVKKYITEIRKKMYFDANPDEKYIFNLNSNDHLGYWLVDIKGHKAELTETGKHQINADFLDELKSDDELVNKLLDYKRLNKILSTYVEGILSRHVNGVIHTDWLAHGTTSGRFSSRNPNCLSMDTQILTDSGFINYEQLTYLHNIACFDGTNLVWHKPTKIWKSEKKKHRMVSIQNQHMDLLTTDNHRFIYRSRETSKIMECFSIEARKDVHILHGAYLNSTVQEEYSDEFLQLLIAAQADGCISKETTSIHFRFIKERKAERLVEILKKLNYEYAYRVREDGQHRIIVKKAKKDVVDIIGMQKHFPTWFVTLNSRQRNLVFEEIFYWDGLFTRRNNYSSNEEHNIDIMRALATLEGFRAHKRIYKTIANNNNFQIDVCRRNYSGTANAKLEVLNQDCEVWCIEVPTGMFVASRNSDSFITGNCQNLPRVKEDGEGSILIMKYANAIRKGFISPPGKKLIDADYSALEPRCFSAVTKDPNLISVWEKEEDLYSRVAIDVFKIKDVSADPTASNYLKKVNGKFRQDAKQFVLAVPYGANASRISETMGVSYKEAEKIINAYLDSYPGLKKYMFNSERDAKKYGYVRSEFGRIRHLPKVKELFDKYGKDLENFKWAQKNGLLKERREYKNGLNNSKNFPIQSMAASIINKAMIAIARILKERKLDACIIMMVHDQIVCIAEESVAEEVKAIMQDCMENTVKIAVRLIAEPIIGENLAESH